MPQVFEFDAACDQLREEIQNEANSVKSLAEVAKGYEQTQEIDKGEMIANLMLAYRHLEDARMRVGKAIQAYDGGVSAYDKEYKGKRTPKP